MACLCISLNVLQLLEQARDLGFIRAMRGNTFTFDFVLTELCKADSAQSVFVLPQDGNLRKRLCAADREDVMKFARDSYRYINMSAVRREVSNLLKFCRSVHQVMYLYVICQVQAGFCYV